MRTRADIIIVGAGFAGLSAAVYLGRALRDTLVVDAGKSMGRWEPKVENYLGFPAGISGRGLLNRARRQADRCSVRFKHDFIETTQRKGGEFLLQSASCSYCCKFLLLATGIFHLPPDIPGVKACLGHSMFFCKDCDGMRVRGKHVAVYGWTDDTVEYALAILAYSPHVIIVCDGHASAWDRRHQRWLTSSRIPVEPGRITQLRRSGAKLEALVLEDGRKLRAQALFTTRGDVMYNGLAKQLGAELDGEGQIVTDSCMRTTVRRLYAAGCVTTANCQMIIASGQGATAAQAINRELFLAGLNSG
ncbi:MAG TPA: NAD(P)/FAD-dependent oxidoreductase [Verrucomicrobiae bacterium]|nr:NAD(P)/FAD-dependent oxidoreductase [Verrucomicrobiae bacterium]